MAEFVVGCAKNLIAIFEEKIIVNTRRHLGYVMYYKNYIEILKNKVDKLRGKSEYIMLAVEDARRHGETIAPEVDQWFTSVNIVYERSTRFLNEEVPENKFILNGWLPNIGRRYILSKKAKEKYEKWVDNLEAEDFNRISYPAPPPALEHISNVEFRSFESRIPAMNQLMNWLKDDTTQIVSVCGMAGSGKTALVKEVARRLNAEKLFDEIIWAVVSKEHDLMRVQEDLAKWLGLRYKTTSLEGRANELWKRLLQSKKGNLVILDDVWKHIDLKNIGIPFGYDYKNCKVVLTSRNIEVCKAMGCHGNILHLDMLTESEAWSFLAEMVGDSLNDPDLYIIASEIAKKCGRLPISVVCLGRALKDKRIEVWKDTLQKLQKNIVPENIEGIRDDVYKSLQASFDLLEDEGAKKIFLLCCLYPEYANVPLEALVRCAIGLDFFNGIDSLIQARERVRILTEKLISCFLLLRGDRKSAVKVHNVVRAMGISVAFTSKPNTGQFSAVVIHDDRWPSSMEYVDYNAVSVVSDEISVLPSSGLNFQKLEYLQLACPKLSLEKLNNLFEGMEKVRVVELWNMPILSLSALLVSVPRDISVLSLDCKIENIGDIMSEEFANLKILSFGNSDIKDLPRQIRNFPNLRLLDMSSCRLLERISPGVISSLCLLEELDTGSKCWGDEEEGDASLTELESLTRLVYLGIRIKSLSFVPKKPLFEKLQRYVISVGVDTEKADSFNNRMLSLKLESTDTQLDGGIDKLLRKSTEKVFLTGDGIKTALLELSTNGFQQVKNLTVEFCNSEGTEYLSDYSYSSNDTGVFSNLEKLRIEKMRHLKGILRHDLQKFPVRLFSKLRKLHLSFLPEMTHLFTWSVATNLVHLESLHMDCCTIMQQLILSPRSSALESTSENKIVFPRLTDLILTDLASLVCFSYGINLEVEFLQLKVLKLEYLQNFHTFCPEEINPFSKGNHKGADYESLFGLKVEFSSLAELTLTNVSNIKKVWRGHLPNLVNLRGLYIQFCHMLEEVISVHRPYITTIRERIVFLKLKELILVGLKRLTFFCGGSDHVEFPQLKVLRLCWLPHFRTFCREEATDFPSSVFVDKVTFPSLERLEVSELDSVEELWSNQLSRRPFGKLRSLRVEKCHKLVNIFPSDLKTMFPNLENIEVEKCDSLEQVWGSKGVQMRNLKTLIVCECPKLRNVCSFNTFKGLSNLQILDISRCEIMEVVVADDKKDGNINDILTLNKLKEVKLAHLQNLNYFSDTKYDMELAELTQVTIKSCPKMHTFSR